MQQMYLQKKMEPCVNIIDFAIYVAFFPIIISGPISRASFFLPQLKNYSISVSNFLCWFLWFKIIYYRSFS